MADLPTSGVNYFANVENNTSADFTSAVTSVATEVFSYTDDIQVFSSVNRDLYSISAQVESFTSPGGWNYSQIVDYRLNDEEIKNKDAIVFDIKTDQPNQTLNVFFAAKFAAKTPGIADWGDYSTTYLSTDRTKTTLANMLKHTYTMPGYYTVVLSTSLTAINFGFSHLSATAKPYPGLDAAGNSLPISLRKITSGMIGLSNYSLYGCPNLSSVTIDSATKFVKFGLKTFNKQNCITEFAVKNCPVYTGDDDKEKSQFSCLTAWHVMKSGSFSNNPKLKTFNIGLTHISCIETGALSNNAILANVVLFNSTASRPNSVFSNQFTDRLSCIQANAISKCPKLTTLDFSGPTKIAGICSYGFTAESWGYDTQCFCEVDPNAFEGLAITTVNFNKCKLFKNIEFIPDMTLKPDTQILCLSCRTNIFTAPIDNYTSLAAASTKKLLPNFTRAEISCIKFRQPDHLSSILYKITAKNIVNQLIGVSEFRYPDNTESFTNDLLFDTASSISSIYYPDGINCMHTNAASVAWTAGKQKPPAPNSISAIRLPFIGRFRGAFNSINATVHATMLSVSNSDFKKLSADSKEIYYFPQADILSSNSKDQVAVKSYRYVIPQTLTNLSIGYATVVPWHAFQGLSSLKSVTFEHARCISDVQKHTYNGQNGNFMFADVIPAGGSLTVQLLDQGDSFMLSNALNLDYNISPYSCNAIDEQTLVITRS